MSAESFPPIIDNEFIHWQHLPLLMNELNKMLMSILLRSSHYVRPFIVACAMFTVVAVVHAQTSSQLPAPANHINDFAGVIDTQTKSHLEILLIGLKERTNVEFYVATVDATGGQDISDFSRQLAADWKIGSRTSSTKSLLMVVSVASKSSFTQFSRLVQSSLPEGILGDMAQRMRAQLTAGRFTEAVDQGIRLFLNALGPRLGFVVDELEKASPTNTAAVEPTADVMQHPTTEPAQTRPRIVNEVPKPVETVTTTPPVQTEERRTSLDTPGVETTTEEKQPEKSITTQPAKASVRPAKASAPTKKTVDPVDDEAEAEEVELTLTLPLTKRAEKLKSFLETHPDSKARTRATELLISTHAGLGDQFLKAGDAANGVQQLMLAIDEADVAITDKLFTGVISQIPSNLYLRGQVDSAFEAATRIEKKFGSDPKRLLSVASFYVGIERGDEALRIAEEAVKLAPDLAEAHRALALSHHINLQLDEAAAEYKKTTELEPNSKASLTTLADLTRANGRFEDALTQYDKLLTADPKDSVAMAGRVLCLLELGRKDEAATALDAALAAEPRNLALLSGTAYWFAAHGDYEKSFNLARQAVVIEPRYTWAQIALVRSLIGMRRPVGAERAMRYARQYGKFPTLNYELANVVAAMGLYDEAVDILRESFTFKDGQIETLLAGRIPARDTHFLPLLSPERRASIYQPTAADSETNSKMLTNLLALDTALTQSQNEKSDETTVAKAARDFAAGDDGMKSYRQIYAASRLVKQAVALSTAMDLVNAAKEGLEVALDQPPATTAVQADEFRSLRAQALATGTVPDIAEAPRSVLTNLMRGRIEDLTGWILFNQDKYPEAIEHLKEASALLPNGTPSWRNTLWHLGVAFEQTGRNDDALENYIKSYNSGERDPIRRSVIEKLYQKVNGSLAGLDDRVGPGFTTGVTQPTEKPSESPVPQIIPTTETSPAPAQTTPEKTVPEPTTPVETAKPESTPTPTPEPTPTTTPATESLAPTQPNPITEEQLRSAGSRLRSNIKITGRVLDSSGSGISNVVVVLISPSGSVLASTTDNEGFYSFTVTPSQKTYRLIPSKDGFTFSPLDKVFSGLIDDQKGIDFTGTNK